MNKYFSIFVFEFSRRWKGMLMWTVLWILYIALILAFYDSLVSDIEQLKAVLNKMPPELLKAFGSDVDSILTLEGIIHSRFTTFGIIIGGIWAGWMGARVIGGDEKNGSLTWLVTQPVSRLGIYFSKLSALILWMFITNFAIMGVTVFLADVQTSVSVIPTGFFMNTAFALSIYFATLIAIGNLGTMIWNEERGRALAIFSVVFSYALNVIKEFAASPEFVKYFTFGYYFDSNKVAKTGELGWEITILTSFCVLVIAAGAFLFNKRTIQN